MGIKIGAQLKTKRQGDRSFVVRRNPMQPSNMQDGTQRGADTEA